MAKKKKVRVDLRKNRSKPPRQQNWTRGFQEHGLDQEATAGSERVRAKGDLSRRRTIIQNETVSAAGQDSPEMPAADSACLSGRVLRASGEPLPGVYAAGEVAGFGGGGMHGYRALEGTFLGGCLFSGRAAGRAAAAAVR